MLAKSYARVLCALLGMALALGPGAAPAPAEPPPATVSESATRQVLAALVGRKEEERLEALSHLSSLIAVDPSVGRRALPRLRTLLRQRGPAERAALLPLLLRIPDPEARDLWIDQLDVRVETHDVVLAAALLATRQVRGDHGLARRLLAELGKKRASAPRRALLIEALGWMDNPAVDLVLARPRADESWVEASARALALGRRKSPRSIPPLLLLLEHEALAPRVHAWESLIALTHRNLALDAAAWKAWWAQQSGNKTNGDKLPAKPSPKAAGARYAAPKPLHVPHYYEIPIPRPGSKVVFCLDVSQSMYGHGIDQARRELKRTLMDLPSRHAFEIVVFNEKVIPWAKRLVAAHPIQKFLAIAFLDALEPTSYTNLYDAVDNAFGHAGRGSRPVEKPVSLDAIFLLSDGAPNRGRHRADKRVVQHIALMSRREIPVHTIGAGLEVFPLLKAIARETGGRFVDAFD